MAQMIDVYAKKNKKNVVNNQEKSSSHGSPWHSLLETYASHVTTRPLVSDDVEPVTRLLTEQFCQREPLCVGLHLEMSALLPFFREQVQLAIKRGLGVMVERVDGKMLGAATFEDHDLPFQFEADAIPPVLSHIGACLESLKMPQKLLNSLRPRPDSRLLYCSLAAAQPMVRDVPVLPLLLAGVAIFMRPLGFQHAYAKVTNPRVLATMLRLETDFGGKIFHVVKESWMTFGDSSQAAKYPVALVHWSLDSTGVTKSIGEAMAHL